jgi:TolB-like protein
MGKAPKAEIVAAGQHVKIDPDAKSTKAIRSLPPEHFDPITRRDNVEKFYRDTLKDRIEVARREGKWHCEPFRREFIYWVWSWRAEWRARWAWHHRKYLDELLWNEWMLDKAFAAEIAALQRSNPAVDPEYMPPEFASTSPLVVYTDDYINAVYNPAPFLAVLNLKNLKADPSSDWIAAATTDSLLSKLSSFPGLFVADQQQVTQVMQSDKTLASDTVEPLQAARIGKAVDVERVVVGSYVVDGEKVLLNLRIVNAQSGAVEDGISKTIPRDHLLDEMPNLAASLASAMGYAQPSEQATISTLPPPGGARAATPPAMASASGGSPPAVTPAPASPGGTPSNGSSIFDDDAPGSPLSGKPSALPPVAGAPAVPGGPSATSSAAPHTLSSADKLTGDMSFDAAGGPYEIQDKISVASGVKKCKLFVGPGAQIHGGIISLGGVTHITIAGTADQPAILRNIDFQQGYDGYFKAQYAIFENCKFHKTGGYYALAGFTAKWVFDKCLIRGTSFPKITHIDTGIKFTDCTFSGMTFGDIIVGAPKDKPLDYMSVLRKDWRIIDHCRFDDCSVPPTIFWCATASDYTKCRFPVGPAFESDTATDVVAYVSGTSGDAPDKIEQATPPKRAALHITYASEPFQVFAFPK